MEFVANPYDISRMTEKQAKTGSNDRPHRAQIFWTLLVFLGLGFSALTHLSTRGARTAAIPAPSTTSAIGRYSSSSEISPENTQPIDYRLPASR